MSYNTKYYWKIVAWDNHGASATGPIWDFTTENRVPSVPSDPAPYDGETNVDVNHDLSWNCSDLDGDPLTYDIYFGDYSPPPKIKDNWPSKIYDQGTMSGETTYYWKIVAHDNHGGSTEGPIWEFNTTYTPNNPPNKPSNPSPADDATGVLVTATLSWTGGDPDQGDTVFYDVYFGTAHPLTEVSHHQLDTTYDPPGAMSYNTVYYWRIEAWDNQNPPAHTIGDEWSFTTEQEQINHDPGITTITGSYVIKVGQPYDFTFQATDQDNDDIRFIVNWGDGSETSGYNASGALVTLTHTWSGSWDIFQITAKAEDIHGAQGPTATHLIIKINEQQSQQSQPQSQQQQQQSQPSSQPSSQSSSQMIVRSIIRQTTNT